MKLTEVLSEVLRRLSGIDPGYITIARGDNPPRHGRTEAWELRFSPTNATDVPATVASTWKIHYCFERRTWLGQQWSEWCRLESSLGGPEFNVGDVFAADWRIL